MLLDSVTGSICLEGLKRHFWFQLNFKASGFNRRVIQTYVPEERYRQEQKRYQPFQLQGLWLFSWRLVKINFIVINNVNKSSYTHTHITISHNPDWHLHISKLLLLSKEPTSETQTLYLPPHMTYNKHKQHIFTCKRQESAHVWHACSAEGETNE